MDVNYTKLVDIAYNMHTSGNLEEAKSVYEKLLSINPEDLDVKNLYAQLNVSLKNFDLALELLQDVYSKTKLDEILVNIAKVYMHKSDYKKAIDIFKMLKVKDISTIKLTALSFLKLSDYKKAIELYQTLITMEEISFSDLFNLSLAYFYSEQYVEALDIAKKAYEMSKEDIQLNIHIASIYEKTGNYKDAISYLEFSLSKVIDIKIIYRVAILYEKIGDDESAIAYLNEILNIDKNNKDALLKIAIIYKNYDKNVTVDIFNKLLIAYSDDISLIEYLYTIYSEMLLHNEALNLALKLIQHDSKNYVYYTFVGDSYFNLYLYSKAEEMFAKALELNPEYVYSAIKLAQIYSAQNKFDKAIELLNRYPANEIARDDLVFIHCKNKDFSKVKDDYYNFEIMIKSQGQIDERAKSFFYKYNLDKKYGINEYSFIQLKSYKKASVSDYLTEYIKKDCKDKNIKDKRLLIYSSHGVGDLLMVTRYIEQLSKIVSKLILQVPKSCISLLEYNFPYVKFYSQEQIVPEDEYDYTTSTLCLLYLVDIDLNNIYAPDTFLSVSNEKILEKVLVSNKKKVGLFWQGNPVVFPNRSIKLNKILPLFKNNNNDFYSFQIDKIDKESDDLKNKLQIIDLAPQIKNYEDTACFLKNIDVLVTIDSSIAHLAGALGIKTFLLLPYNPEWRWFSDTQNTPWYPSVKIFKQRNENDWDEVISRVEKELE